MAHIDRRNRGGTIRYVARYIDPAGRERSKSFARKVDAERFLPRLAVAQIAGALDGNPGGLPEIMSFDRADVDANVRTACPFRPCHHSDRGARCPLAT